MSERMVNERDDFRVAVQTWLYKISDWSNLSSEDFEKLTKIFNHTEVGYLAARILTINEGK